jgi:hypothetical protein
MNSIETIKQNAIDFLPGILKQEDQSKFENLIGKIVINLSHLKITEKQEKILEKGLTFFLTPGRPDYWSKNTSKITPPMRSAKSNDYLLQNQVGDHQCPTKH